LGRALGAAQNVLNKEESDDQPEGVMKCEDRGWITMATQKFVGLKATTVFDELWNRHRISTRGIYV
jgi:hypothetical protein